MPSPKVVVCFGDSNTHGSVPMRHIEDVRRHPVDQRWPGILAAELGPGWEIHQEGLPGRTTVHPDPIEGDHLSGIAAAPMIIGTHTPIDVVVLALGVNDFKTRFSVTAEDIAFSIERLVTTIRSAARSPERPGPFILVVCPPPILEAGCLAGFYAGGQAKSQALAERLHPVVQRLGAAFLDAGAHVRSSDIDGIHWEATEHGNLARAIAVELRAADLP